MSSHRLCGGARLRARNHLYKAIERYGFGGKVEESMKQEFEDLADKIEARQDFEDLVRAYSGK
jgi:hypothetical protein